tara:strand:+ start:8693 stop:10801 length:2109 start_codon:yes stop_codon:yes gene_type:complete
MQLSFLVLPFVALVLAIPQSAVGGEMRTWTDNQGRKVDAEMTGFRDGKVMMKLANGKSLAFPFDLLSEMDRGYVRENAPIDPRTATRQIDVMVLEKLKEANAEIKEKQLALRDNTKLSREDKLKELENLKFREKMTFPTPRTSDEQFLRRVYLDIAGRIPTYQEANGFLRDGNKNKRALLIDSLLDSEAFVSHFFNYLSDLLRIRDGISMGGLGELKSEAYAEWIKDQIRANTPWDELVEELISAEGYYWESPATGYLLTDYGMELCNLSNTFTVFTGTEITCAQCHDHPFEEVYQMDFYKMAAFFGQVDFKKQANPELKKQLDARIKQLDAEAKAKKVDLRNFYAAVSGFDWSLGEGGANKIKLPFDYKYDDADPNQSVAPATYFGEIVEMEEYATPREGFADWLVSKDNPRFTINIVNRMWKHVFGLGQIEPVHNIPGHLDGQAQNYELVKFLEQLMKELDYDLKAFLSILYKSQTYQREASHSSPTLTMIDKGEYHFPAPIMRRLSAEQLWDSFVAMSNSDPEANQRRILEDYRAIMNTDWANLDLEMAKEVGKAYANLGKGGAMMGNQNRGKLNLIRASELPLPSNVGSFLYTFGQSDKRYIENASKVGTIPQVMFLLNGDLTNKVLSASSGAVIQSAKSARSKTEGIETCFLSILSRRPKAMDREYAEILVKGGDAGADYSDLVWALLNVHEFMFIQ